MKLIIATLSVAVLSGVTSGCAADHPAQVGAPAAKASPAGPTTGFFTVDGRRIYLTCTGDGPRTVLFLSDIEEDSQAGRRVGRTMSHDVRFCAYDRPGTGVSAAVLKPSTGRAAVADLNALIRAAQIPTPVVLVGESWGALTAGMYAGEHPQDVAGLVLITPMIPEDAELLRYVTADYARAFKHFWDAGNDEKVDLNATLVEAAPLLRRLPDVPVRIIEADDSQQMPVTWDLKRIAVGHRRHLNTLISGLHHAQIVRVHAQSPLSDESPGAVASAVSDVLR